MANIYHQKTLIKTSASAMRIILLCTVFILFNRTLKAQTLPLPDHIVILIEENQPNFFIMGNTTAAPYVNALAADSDAAVFTKMYALEHPSQPDYFDLFAGGNQGVLDDNIPSNYPFTTPNMARELLDAGRTFITYSQNLPAVGSDVGSSNGYARKHNPVTNWVGSGTNQVPATTNQPLTAWPTDFSQLPTVSYVVPVEDSDMHNGFGNSTIAAGDYWMQEHLDSYIQWARTHNSLFIYTFDEDNGFQGNNIPTLFFGPMVKGGSYSDNWNLYNILRTIEDIYGTGHAGNAASSAPIANVWRTTATGIPEAGASGVLNVYPNPSSSLVKFDGTKLGNANSEVILTDVTGRIIKQFYLPESNVAEISTTEMPSGMYFYNLSNEGHTLQTGKLIITH